MTAKNRHKNIEKSAASSGQEDASKRSQRSSSNGGMSSGPGPQGSRSGGCLGLVLTSVFYIAIIGAAGFAAFYLQQVVEEIHQTNAKNEERAQQSSELSRKMETVLQQVESLKSVVDGLESSLGITRVELEGAVTRMKRGEVETRRVDEALQRLQNELLRDLTQGINEVKEAREKDFSSLEKTVEERLAEVSQSVRASVAEFTEAQGEAQSQLADLKARLGHMEDPALIKQELSAIVDAVAEIKTSKEDADASADSLRQQINKVREELQTRNQEVASLSQEVGSVRSVVQETTGSLRGVLSAAEGEVQVLKDKAATLEGAVEQVTEAVQRVEKEAAAAATQAQKQSEDLETRVKTSEESLDSLSVSVSDVTDKVESLFAKYDAHQSGVAAQEEAEQKARGDMEALRSSVEELRVSMEALGETHRNQGSQGSSLGEKVEDLETRLMELEGGGGRAGAEQLEGLREMVAGLESKTAKLEGHDEAIAALQEALQRSIQEVAAATKQQQEE